MKRVEWILWSELGGSGRRQGVRSLGEFIATFWGCLGMVLERR